MLLDFVEYTAENKSGYSKLDPIAFLPIFTVVFFLGLIGHSCAKRKIRSALAIQAIGITGMIFCFIVTQLNILNSHENWIAAGMPERNPHAESLLLGFVIAATIASFLYVFLIGAKFHKKSQNSEIP